MEDSQRDDFSLKNYGRCLDISLEKGFNFFKLSQLEEAEKSKKAILLRHDIDTQLDVALEMSKIESSKNIFSTQTKL